jgi:hypothetical protein
MAMRSLERVEANQFVLFYAPPSAHAGAGAALVVLKTASRPH